MNEQLEKSLAVVIEKATTGVEAGINFLSAEIPEVIHQLLVWKMVEAGITATFTLMIFISASYFFVKYSGKGEKYEDTGKYRGYSYKMTLTHDEDGDLGPHFMLSGTIAGLTIFISGGVFIGNFLTAIKIWIAPKVYLIEYAATLAK